MKREHVVLVISLIVTLKSNMKISKVFPLWIAPNCLLGTVLFKFSGNLINVYRLLWTICIVTDSILCHAVHRFQIKWTLMYTLKTVQHCMLEFAFWLFIHSKKTEKKTKQPLSLADSWTTRNSEPISIIVNLWYVVIRVLHQKWNHDQTYQPHVNACLNLWSFVWCVFCARIGRCWTGWMFHI